MPGGPRPGGGPGKRGGDGRSGGARNERGGRSGAGGREAGGGRDARGGRSDGGGRGAPGGRGDGAGRSGGAPGGRRGAEDGGGGSGARATGGRDDGWRGGEAAGRGGGRSGGGAPSGGRDGAGGREAPARGRGVDRRRDAEPSSGGTGSGGASGGDVLYGRNAVHEALRAGRRRVRQVWATDHALTEPWLAGGPGRPNAQRARPDELEDRCGSPGHQGVCALVDPYPYADANQLLAGRDGLVLVLDEVQDVQNLGAICRTAECAGALGVVIPERRSAEVTPAACKASAGAVEHLRVARVKNVADALVKAKANGAWVYGAAMQGAVPWTQPDYAGAVVLVLGAEGRGLRPRVAASCDALVTLPVRGRIDSLNVGAAAAALVYEILRARH